MVINRILKTKTGYIIIFCFGLLFFIYGYYVLILYCYNALFFDLRHVYIVSYSFIWLYCFRALYAKIKRYNTIDNLL